MFCLWLQTLWFACDKSDGYQKAYKRQSVCSVINGTTLSVCTKLSIDLFAVCTIRQVGRRLFSADISPRLIQKGD